MSNHTPGPWQVTPGGIRAANGDIVARTCEYGPQSETPHAEAANAALIIKAPAMLTLLRQAVDQFPDLEAGNGDIVDWLVEFVNRAREVIDK